MPVELRIMFVVAEANWSCQPLFCIYILCILPATLQSRQPNFGRRKRQGLSYCMIAHLLPMMFVLYIEVYVLYKLWCKYKPNQATDYDVNPLTTSKTALI